MRSVPSDTAVYITADHGMVDAPHALRIDLAHDAELAAGVRHVGGEPRALQLYCEEGAGPTCSRPGGSGWASGPGCSAGPRPSRKGGSARSRRACSSGSGTWSWPCATTSPSSTPGRRGPELLALLGLHGSLTHEEVSIPLLHAPARDSA